MQKEVKRRWLKALRSGKYKKTRGRLRSSEGFCCLGVLCDIERIQHTPDEAMIPGHGLQKLDLPWFQAEHLAKLNDGSLLPKDRKPKRYRAGVGLSFEAIADYISRNVKVSS